MASQTKNSKNARRFVQPDLAGELKAHVARNAPGAPVFTMPPSYEVAEMLRSDLADARSERLRAAQHDSGETRHRVESDFSAAENHDEEHLDSHSLRHTCGVWLAKAGVQVKVVQTVMRHSTITLTMDTYGHLLPGQESDAVARFPDMRPPATSSATGTVDVAAERQQY